MKMWNIWPVIAMIGLVFLPFVMSSCKSNTTQSVNKAGRFKCTERMSFEDGAERSIRICTDKETGIQYMIGAPRMIRLWEK